MINHEPVAAGEGVCQTDLLLVLAVSVGNHVLPCLSSFWLTASCHVCQWVFIYGACHWPEGWCEWQRHDGRWVQWNLLIGPGSCYSSFPPPWPSCCSLSLALPPPHIPIVLLLLLLHVLFIFIHLLLLSTLLLSFSFSICSTFLYSYPTSCPPAVLFHLPSFSSSSPYPIILLLLLRHFLVFIHHLLPFLFLLLLLFNWISSLT